MAGTETGHTGSRYITSALAAEGVDKLFGIIGEGNAHLIDRSNDEDLTFVQARHEQAAVSMADAHARIQEDVAVCTLTHGPGLTNGATGIAAADRDNVPIVVIVGDTAISGRETSLQYLDHPTFSEPISVYQTRIETTATIPEVLSKAFDRARTRSGPVIVEVPTDVQEGQRPDEPYTPIPRPRQRIRPDEDRLEEAAELLSKAEDPVILAGGGAKRSNAGDVLADFAKRLGAPIATTLFGRGVLPEAHSMVSGVSGTFMTPANDELIWDADVAVVVGARLSGKTTRYGELYSQADVIQIDIDEESIATHQIPNVGMVADAQSALEALSDRIDAHPDRAKTVANTIADSPSPGAIAFEQRDDEIDPGAFTTALSERVPDDAILTIGSGNNTGFPSVFHEIGEGGSALLNGNFGTMGFSVPAAMGAQVAAPEKTVVAYTGDGEFLQVLQEIETGVRLGLPVIVAILNDRSYGIIRLRQEISYGRETGSSYDSPNFASIAEGFGAKGAIVRSVGELDVVDDFLASSPSVPLVLDVRTIPGVSRPGFPPY